MADMIKFYKGALASLPTTGTNGALYITTDEGAIYLGTGVGMKRLGDFVQVDAVANLPASANTSALYYCVAENVLAKWTGTEWKQVNKQPTKDELKVLLGLNAEGEVTQAIAAAKKAGDDAQADVDTLTTYVGTFTHDTAKSVVEYIDAKTSGIATSDNLELLTGRVTQAEKDIDAIEADYLKDADKTELEGKITTAQTAADNAQGYAEGVAGNLKTHTDNGDIHITAAEREDWNGKATLDDVKGLNYATKDEAQGYANAKDAAIEAAQSKADQAYELAGQKATMTEVNTAIANAGHAVKSEVDQAIADLEAADVTLQGNIDKKVDQSAYNTKMAALEGEDDRLEGLIGGNTAAIEAIAKDYLKADDKTALQGSIDGVSGRVATIEGDYLKNADKEALQGAIDLKVAQSDYDTKMEEIGEDIDGLQNQINLIMNNPDTEKVVDSITEFTAWVEEHGTLAEGMRVDIDKNKEDIAAEAERAGKAESDLAGRLDTLEAKFTGEGSVEALIATAKQEAIDAAASAADAKDEVVLAAAKKYTDDEIAELNISQYAKQADLDSHTDDAVAHITADERTAWNAAESNAKTYAKDYADGLNANMNTRVEALEAIDHDHANKAELDLIASGDKAKWDAAEAKAHEHANAAELAKIADGDVAKWNAAEQNAKDYADGLNTAMDTRVKVLEAIDHEAYKAADAELATAIEAAKTDASNKDAVVLSEAQKAVAAAKTELQGALDTYKTSNDAVVAGKADKATTLAGYGITDAMTADQINALLTWGEF